MRWAIFYDNGTIWDDTRGPWRDAPAEGVLAVATYAAGRYDLHVGADYYQLEEDTCVTREAAIILRAVGLREMAPVKFGRYASCARMARAHEQAAALRREWGV